MWRSGSWRIIGIVRVRVRVSVRVRVCVCVECGVSGGRAWVHALYVISPGSEQLQFLAFVSFRVLRFQQLFYEKHLV